MKNEEEKKLATEMHHEFQLERVILFSDAVFAIAITLMVIELLFPEVKKGETSEELWQSMRPMIFNFGAFIVSFFFIGMFWYRHLKLCGLLKDYNVTFIVLNLMFLFFIVLFPFSVSTMLHLSPGWTAVPSAIYFGNVFFASVSHYILYYYLLGKGAGISKPVSAEERAYILNYSFRPIILISLLGACLLLSLTVFKNNPEILIGMYAVIGVAAFIYRRKSKERYKKLKENLTVEQQEEIP